MKHRKTTVEPTFNGMPINTSSEKGLSCREDILKGLLDMLIYSLSKGRRMFTRFDVRFTNGYSPTSCNSSISQFFNSFAIWLRRRGLEPDYLWVREQSREKHQHYHCVLLTKATDSVTRELKDYRYLLRVADDIWCRKLGLEGLSDCNDNSGLIDYCNKERNGVEQKNGLILYQNDIYGEAFQKAYRWGSYLCKDSQKGYAGGYNEWGHSQVPLKFRSMSLAK